jgi:hypothetical protein
MTSLFMFFAIFGAGLVAIVSGAFIAVAVDYFRAGGRSGTTAEDASRKRTG